MRAEFDPAAEYARRCMEATLGLPVGHWDHGGRQGAHDLRYVDAGRVVAAEVKLVVKPTYRAASGVAEKYGYTLDDRLSRLWDVWLEHDARWKRARELLPPILRRLELLKDTGVEYHPLWRLEHRDRAVFERLVALKVKSMWSQPPTEKHPPGFYLMPAGWAGFGGTVDYLAEFACEILASDEMATLRRQLEDADAAERHAFLVIGHEYLEETMPLRDTDELPSSAPTLPPPVDTLWLLGTAVDSRLIAWLPGRGWLNAKLPAGG